MQLKLLTQSDKAISRVLLNLTDEGSEMKPMHLHRLEEDDAPVQTVMTAGATSTQLRIT